MRDEFSGCFGPSKSALPLCGSISQRLAKGRSPTAPPKQIPKNPFVHSGAFKVDITDPRFTVDVPGATDVRIQMTLSFDGVVFLPPGIWRVGIVQFLWNDRVRQMYSSGGEIFHEQNGPSLLDNVSNASDVWFKDCFQTEFLNSGAENRKIQLTTIDNPDVTDVGFVNTRCNGTIRENVVYIERTALFFAIVGCKSIVPSGPFVPLLATFDLYGFYWKVTPTLSNKSIFKIIKFSRTERATFSGVASGASVHTELANDVDDRVQETATNLYKGDCQRRAPRPSSEQDFWIK